MKKYIERLAWGTDAGFYRMIPEEVLHPATEADVQAILARAHKEGKHITFRAAGTSLSGQAISDSLEALKPYNNREDVELIMSPIKEYHDPKKPDCLMFELKVFVRPRKEIKYGK
jgi:hypothetical protein